MLTAGGDVGVRTPRFLVGTEDKKDQVIMTKKQFGTPHQTEQKAGTGKIRPWKTEIATAKLPISLRLFWG